MIKIANSGANTVADAQPRDLKPVKESASVRINISPFGISILFHAKSGNGIIPDETIGRQTSAGPADGSILHW
jgi:hypothetical protein